MASVISLMDVCGGGGGDGDGDPVIVFSALVHVFALPTSPSRFALADVFNEFVP